MLSFQLRRPLTLVNPCSVLIAISTLACGTSSENDNTYEAGLAVDSQNLYMDEGPSALLPSRGVAVCGVKTSYYKDGDDAFFDKNMDAIYALLKEWQDASGLYFVYTPRCSAPVVVDGKKVYKEEIRIANMGLHYAPYVGLPRGQNDDCVASLKANGQSGTIGGGAWGTFPVDQGFTKYCPFNTLVNCNNDEDPELCAYHTVHEVGHTLGFRHEFERQDQSTCSDILTVGRVKLTPPDSESVMNYGKDTACSSMRTPNFPYAGTFGYHLSAYDRLGADIAYPHPVWSRTFDPVTTNKIAFGGMSYTFPGTRIVPTWRYRGALRSVFSNFVWERPDGSIVGTDPDLLSAGGLVEEQEYVFNMRFTDPWGRARSGSQKVVVSASKTAATVSTILASISI